MTERKTNGRARRRYSRPMLRRRRKLADVAEGGNIFVTGHVTT